MPNFASSFEVFTRPVVPPKQRPQVAILRRSILSLNRPAFAALRSPAAVHVHYDSALHIVRIRPTDVRADGAHFVRRSGRGSSSMIVAARACIKNLALDSDGSRRWDAYLDAGELCVDLRSDATPVTSNRARRGQRAV